MIKSFKEIQLKLYSIHVLYANFRNQVFFQRIDSYLNSSNVCIIFKHGLKNDRHIQPYLNQGIATKYKNIISKGSRTVSTANCPDYHSKFNF